VVAAGLAAALDDALPGQTGFFVDTEIIASPAVRDAITRRSGRFLRRDIDSGAARLGPIPTNGNGKPLRVGLFPSVKSTRGAFDIEALMVHDLSTLITPQFHIPGNVSHHMDAITGDIASSQMVFAVSAATRADMIAYLGIDPDLVRVVPNGVTMSPPFVANAQNLGAHSEVEPYMVILGTREPRKNITKIFEMLELWPEMLDAHRYVFAGRMGWMEDHHVLPASLEPFQKSGRILFTGFVSEAQKYTLLHHAAASLYPSLFEGFGLPVLESMAAGTPCVASFSSSIPEVSGGPACLFDPLSASELRRAIGEILARRKMLGNAAIREACVAAAAPFSWETAAALILQNLTPLAQSWTKRRKTVKARPMV